MNDAPAPALSIARLFDSPGLAGPQLRAPRISADGARVTYLQSAADDQNRLNLWEYDVPERRARLLVDSAPPAGGGAPALDAAERARRERLRTASLRGVLDYAIDAGGRRLLVPVDGELRLLERQAEGPPRQLTVIPGAVIDARFSPSGSLIAYVRDQNLIVQTLATAQEQALTTDGGGPITNGLAEFVAQEEMNRHRGYWWSPDERHLAFTRVDESAMAVMQRLEIQAETLSTVAERYPAAGQANALVRLGVVAAAGGEPRWIDVGEGVDFYLARVDWLPDGRTLAVQRQHRDQRTLDLLFADIDTGHSRVVLTERSPTWIELNDELTFLRHAPEFIWASNRDGFTHLYLHGLDGRMLRRLTEGDWNVDDFHNRAIKGVDEKRRLVYFTATAAGPAGRALYAASLDADRPTPPKRLSEGDGIHQIAMAADAGSYVDTYSSKTQPPQTSLRSTDGALIAFLNENRLDATHPDAPYAATNSSPEFGTLQSADGQTLWYRLWKPVDFEPGRRHPAIVDVYGGPGVQRVLDDWSGASFTQILTRAGFVVFQLDNRGSGFRGAAFQERLQGRFGRIEVEDQVLGARWLATQDFVDPARLGVWGWSYGGYLSLMLMLQAPEIFRAGVAGAPVTDWTLYDTHYTERYLGRPQDNPAGYLQSAVLTHLPGLRGSLLVMHGMADDNVLVTHSLKLIRALQELGKPFEMMLYPGAKHGLLRERDGRHAYATILEFFRRQLGS